ncbi:MAG: hypothetical protein ACC634_08070, partial [Hyphomicrobiales bacterium]
MATETQNRVQGSVPEVQLTKPQLSSDDWIMRAFMGVIALYLIVSLALPLYTMLSKSFSTFSFDLGA